MNNLFNKKIHFFAVFLFLIGWKIIQNNKPYKILKNKWFQ